MEIGSTTVATPVYEGPPDDQTLVGYTYTTEPGSGSDLGPYLGWLLGGGGAGGGCGGGLQLLGGLPSTQATAIANAFAKFQNGLHDLSADCQKNVIAPLTQALGFDLSGFEAYLAKGANFYNGLTVASRRRRHYNHDSSGQPSLRHRSDNCDRWTFWQHPDGCHDSILSPTPEVFFNPSAISTAGGGLNGQNALLFHEALHGYGGTGSYSDQGLLDLFRTLDPSINVSGASSQISDYIGKHCF